MCNSDLDKDKAVRRLQLCRNCLKVRHHAQSCQSRRCQRCDGRHNTRLHHFQSTKQFDTTKSHFNKEQNYKGEDSSSQPQQLMNKAENSIKLSTNINNQQNHKDSTSQHDQPQQQIIKPTEIPTKVRFGSQLNFITTAIANELGLKKRRVNIPIIGIGGQGCKSDFVTELTFESRTSRFQATIEASIMPRITDYDSNAQIDISLWKLPPNIILADPACFKNQRIDMLLGAGIFFELFIPGEFKISNDLPLLRNTKLGWVLAGSVPTDTKISANCHIAAVVRKFWEIKNHDTPSIAMTREEYNCEEHFRKNIRLNDSNQFVVRLPFKEDPSVFLGDSFEVAKRRFLALERKLEKNQELKQLYASFMQEYEDLGHMSPIDESKLCNTHFFIPHHCVMKPESTSTKLRVVFDASAKSSSGNSLNDSLMVGPTVQPDLFSIITKFRMHRYVFTGDINDCLTGAETLEDAKSLLTDVAKILKQRNFELRKFCSNHPDILQSVPEEQKGQLVAFHQSEVIKTLGLIWDPALDAFRFKFDLDEINENEKVCKRTVLSNLAILFDPLGLLAPVIVLGKLFLQELWKTKSSWDYQLPEDQANKWLRYFNSFSMLKDLSIPRYASCPSKMKNVELHAFSDSSQKAYGSCVYIRSVDDNEIINSHLLYSKSRICPLKVTTIARLELQRAVLMVELVARLLPLFSNEFRRVCFYTDSTTVLAWIKSPSCTWDTYMSQIEWLTFKRIRI
ncbi:uncharacterized protein LOC129906835 [Episyrphus balteatus]|uniref:uncharacterized protein LOC129906835 n=1 Tax=Episyrphus balteatus TaxID=286459 RepID=UPI0024862F7A|nr:uncharacterized protein LOC129906835 [Episyrphus balteatus]